MEWIPVDSNTWLNPQHVVKVQDLSDALVLTLVSGTAVRIEGGFVTVARRAMTERWSSAGWEKRREWSDDLVRISKALYQTQGDEQRQRELRLAMEKLADRIMLAGLRYCESR